MDRCEQIISGQSTEVLDLGPGVRFRPFASPAHGAEGFCTGQVMLATAARLAYHRHTFSEAVTVLEGVLTFDVEGRRYDLYPLDCIHVPAGTVHSAWNSSSREPCVAHSSFASPTPDRELVEAHFSHLVRGLENSRPHDPEQLARLFKTTKYPLSRGTRFRDLFAARFGSRGICGGYGEFSPGTGLPCHLHKFDESITIVRGEAVCEVAGRHYRLSGCDTGIIPRGLPHRFYNDSDDIMAMVWVYAGDEPERTLIDQGFCDGTLPLNGLAEWVEKYGVASI